MSAEFQLIESGWDQVLDEAARAGQGTLRIICPFLKKRTIERILKHRKTLTIQVITRFNLDEFRDGVSDTEALGILLRRGAQIRGVCHLHTKMYLFGDKRAIVTSANMTEAALYRNHEFGFVAEQPLVAQQCGQYFQRMWCQAGPDLTAARLDEWQTRIAAARAAWIGTPSPQSLGDEGVAIGLAASPASVSPALQAAPQAFVKFFGESHRRQPWILPVHENLIRSGCHWACTFPKDKRPRKAQDGALMFMGQMVKDPRDTVVFGRAIGIKHEPGRDDASQADKERRPWKEKWPHYVRVHDGAFVAGTLGNGVRLTDLMDALGSDSFQSTQENARRGQGNTDPRRAYRQQAAVQLSPEGQAWMNEALERAFTLHGKIGPDELGQLDWPENPGVVPGAGGQ